MKYLELACSDGTHYRIPAQFVAEHRARYYVAKDGDDTSFGAEVGYAMGDDYELRDWAQNNMNWVDVAAIAWRIEGRPLDMQTEWVGGDLDVVDA